MKKIIVAISVSIVSLSCVRDNTVLETLVDLKSEVQVLKGNLEQLRIKQAISDSILHKKIDDKMDSLKVVRDTLATDSIPKENFGF